MHAWCPTRRLWVPAPHCHQHRCLVDEAGWLCRARCSGSLPRYPQVTLSIWQTRKDIIHLCQRYTIINLLYPRYTWYIPYPSNSWWDMPRICWTQSLIYSVYIVYTRHILFGYPWSIPGISLVYPRYIPEINVGYVPEGYAKYMTNQKRYTTVISEYILLWICYI